MGKKLYERPVLTFERFVPNEYCDTCFSYKATLVCKFGENGGGKGEDGNDHGEPCANSTVEVTIENGKVTLVGHEGGNKTQVDLTSVNIPGIETFGKDGTYASTATWKSSYAGLNYTHVGNGTVTVYDYHLIWPGHPMHS